MLEFFQTYGPSIFAGILGAGSLASAIVALRNVFKINKKVNKETKTVDEKIQITQDGIVKAFQTAKLPNEIKLSLITQVKDVLTEARDKIIEEVKKNEQLRTNMMMLILKILSFTAASNKLTEDEKKQIEDMIKLISNEDSTIEV